MKHNSSFEFRFDGVRRLYGDAALTSFQNAHVLVVGLGGVGSWVVEALARTGVGEFTLVDMDDVCLSNTNRQIHAVQGNIGKPKVDALRSRVLSIDPECLVHCVQDFYSQDMEKKLSFTDYDVVVDCIDNTLNKEQLSLVCRQFQCPQVVVGRAGGLSQPSQVRVADLSKTEGDSMLANMRKTLRRRYQFPRGKKSFGIPAVYSMERPTYVDSNGCPTSDRPVELKGALDCAGGLGSSVAVTATFAMFAAGEALDILSSCAPGKPPEKN